MEAILAILASFVANLMPHGIVRVWRHWRERDIRRFWSPLLRPRLTPIVPPADVDTLLNGTGVLDHLGLADISLTLAPLNNPGKSSIQAPTRSDQVAEELLRENLLVVGGPVPNTVARFLLGRPEVAYNFQSIEGGNLSYDIICQRNSEFRIIAPRPAGNIIDRDYGIITRIRNPYNGQREAVVVCGCFGWGTRAAARSLTDNAIVKEILKKAGNHFQVIVEVSVDQFGIATEPRVIWQTLIRLE